MAALPSGPDQPSPSQRALLLWTRTSTQYLLLPLPQGLSSGTLTSLIFPKAQQVLDVHYLFTYLMCSLSVSSHMDPHPWSPRALFVPYTTASSSPTINVGWRVNTVNESTRCAGQVVRSQARYLSRMASILPTDQFPLSSIVSLSSNIGVTSPVERKSKRNTGEQIEGLGREETRLRKSWLGFCSYQTLSQHPDFWSPYKAEPLSPVVFLNQTQRDKDPLTGAPDLGARALST